MMQEFSLFNSLIGGLCIGLSASLFIFLTGRIAGISGIAGGLFLRKSNDSAWRVLFLSGLIAGGFLYQFLREQPLEFELNVPVPIIILGGLLVGFGTRLGSGCTSGHGVCGIARLSPRSIVATFIFIGVAMLTFYISRYVLGIGT